MISQERLFPLAPSELVTFLLRLSLGPPIGTMSMLGASMLGLCGSVCHNDCLWLCEKAQPSQVILGPAGALKNLSDGFWAERIAEVMIHKQHSAPIRVLVDMVGAAGFSAAEALMFNSSDPFPCGTVT